MKDSNHFAVHEDVRDRVRQRKGNQQKSDKSWLTKYKNLYKRKWKVGTKFLVGVSLLTLFIGISIGALSEYQFKFVKFLPFTTAKKNFNLANARMDQIELFANEISRAREIWIRYNLAPEKFNEKEFSELIKILTSSLGVFNTNIINDVNDNWKIYALYYYSYAQLMSIDVSHELIQHQHLQTALERIAEIERIIDNNDVRLDFAWHLKANGELRKLFLYIHAQNYNSNPANRAIYEEASKYLISIPRKEINAENMKNDRIIEKLINAAIEEGSISLE